MAEAFGPQVPADQLATLSIATHDLLINLEAPHLKTTAILDSVKGELLGIKTTLEGSKGKLDQKGAAKISEKASSGIKKVEISQSELQDFQNLLKTHLLKTIEALKASERAFNNCLEDNLKIRKKYGLQSVTADTYLNRFSSLVDASMMSIPKDDDQFFDADDGDFSDELSSEDVSSINQNERTDSDNDDSDYCSTNPSVPVIDNIALVPRVSTPGQSPEFTRRTKLPATAASMENISIMGLLRNNVGKDLSTGKLSLIQLQCLFL
jgi:hypothetical protein